MEEGDHSSVDRGWEEEEVKETNPSPCRRRKERIG